MTSIKITSALKLALVMAVFVLANAGPRAQSLAGTLPAGQHHRWMDDLFTRRPAAMTQSLARFIFPGTHDSGTYRLEVIPACEGCKNADIYTDREESCRADLPEDFHGSHCTTNTTFMAMFGQNWGIAQHLTVLQQLDAGARRFDLRFFRATADDVSRTGGLLTEGTFYTHHSLAGPDSIEIFDDIATFVNRPGHEREIIIIEFQQLMEGADTMSTESLAILFNQLRDRIGPKMARKQDSACASDPSCQATARFGHATTIADFLAQGSQVIVTSTRTTDNAPDIWNYIDGVSSYQINELNSSAVAGYPSPDNDYYPWRTEKEVQTLIEDLSAKRDNHSQDEMFTLGVEVGLDEDEDVPAVKSKGLLRSVACPLDPANVSGYCTAINDDWDQFETLRDAAEFLNPKALSALVSLRRDRVNIVTSDHYTTAFTEEVFKLNYGATQVRYQIDRVIESENPPLDSIDFDSNPDYYPVFVFPGLSPVEWQVRAQRNAQRQNDDNIIPFWPAWASFPNDWGTATVSFGIKDADGVGDDDWARINVPFPGSPRGNSFDSVTESVPITACVSNATNCLKFNSQQETTGLSVADAAEVHYRRSACVWSWLPGDIFDPASLCEPEVSIQNATTVEGNSGTSPMELFITLNAPRTEPVSVRYSTSNGTAIAGSDYIAVTNELATFAPGQTRITAKVQVNGDTDFESDETLTVTLGEVEGAVIRRGSATGTIKNDDGGTLKVGTQSRVEGSGSNTAFNFPVTLSNVSTQPVTVRYQTSSLTAAAGRDYIAVPETILTFAPGETSKTVTVTVLGDHAVEGDETFYVTLSQATNATIDFTPGDGRGTIVNDDKAASLSGPGQQSGDEGTGTFNLGTLTDGRPGSWTISVNWGDGTTTSSPVGTTGGLTGVHEYADSGSYTVTVLVSDSDGVPSSPITFIVTIANVSPTATFANNSPIDEGGRAIVSFSNPFDPSNADVAAGFHYAFSCSNDSLAAATYATSGSSPSSTCAYDDNGPRVVRGRIIDKDGGHTEYSTTVTVNNVAPTATFVNNGPIDEGGTATVILAGAFDPSTVDTTTGIRYAFSCANQPLAPVTYAAASSSPSTTCPFANDGVFTIRGLIIDKDGGATEYTTPVTVRDITPVMTAAPGQSGSEGSSITFNIGALADPSNDGPWTISIAWGDSHVESFPIPGTGALTRNHTYADNGAYSVTVSARDANQVASNTVGFTATISNVAPQVSSLLLEDEAGAQVGTASVALIGLPIDLEAAFTDVGVLDTHVGSIAWGDGTSGAGTITESGGAGTLRASHTFGTPGTFTIGVTITDDDSGVGMRQATIVVTDAMGAVCALPQLIKPLLSGSSTAAVSALTRLLAQIQGNNDGLAANGACDMFAKNNYVAAVVKLAQAVQTIESLLAAGGVTPGQVDLLRRIESRLILAAKSTALALSRTATDAQKLAAAAAIGQLADAAMGSGNYVVAIAKWLDAVRLLAPLT